MSDVEDVSGVSQTRHNDCWLSGLEVLLSHPGASYVPLARRVARSEMVMDSRKVDQESSCGWIDRRFLSNPTGFSTNPQVAPASADVARSRASHGRLVGIPRSNYC